MLLNINFTEIEFCVVDSVGNVIFGKYLLVGVDHSFAGLHFAEQIILHVFHESCLGNLLLSTEFD